jgi:uncharacterized membrane protein YcaP (DUF421 family)
MLEPMTPLVEIVLRVAIVYLALMVMLRLSGRREVGQLTPLDLLGMLLLSETVSPVLSKQDTSLPGGLTAAATLLALAALVGRASYRSRRLEHWLDGDPVPLVCDGAVDRQACERHRITKQELDAALRKGGVRTPADVELAMLESNGEISVVEAKRT